MAERADSLKEANESRRWVGGSIETPNGQVPRVAAKLTWRDRLGSWAVCWNIGRKSYRVEPGLYAVGNPVANSPVLATANYKLSFDALRQELVGLDVWLLVLDTQGINVWCAAGKGTFGTEELIHRMEVTGVARVAGGAVLILPQLAAPGVAIMEVRQRTGFRVVYGPVRAHDIPAYFNAGMTVTPEMRRVTFTLRERLLVVPVELAQRFIPTLLIMLGFFLVACVGRQGFHLATDQWSGLAVAVWVNYAAGLILSPALLPWLPGRSFALKGAEIGVLTGGVLWLWGRYGLAEGIALGLLSVAACSFLGLMFTGSTPYTSASGVRREIRWAIPLQIAVAAAGLVLWVLVRWRYG